MYFTTSNIKNVFHNIKYKKCISQCWNMENVFHIIEKYKMYFLKLKYKENISKYQNK